MFTIHANFRRNSHIKIKIEITLKTFQFIHLRCRITLSDKEVDLYKVGL